MDMLIRINQNQDKPNVNFGGKVYHDLCQGNQ